MKEKKKNLQPFIILFITALVWLSLNLFLFYYSHLKPFPEAKHEAGSSSEARIKSSQPGEVTHSKSAGAEELKIPFGKSLYLPNTVNAYILVNSNWIGLGPGQTVYEKDEIRTSPSSELDISIDSRKKIRLYENSEAVLSGSIFNEKRGGLPSALVIRGKLYANSGFEFMTGSGTTIVGNSETSVEKKDNLTRVTVLSGTAEVSSSGRKVTVKKNQAAIIEDGKQPGEPFDLPGAPSKIKLKTH